MIKLRLASFGTDRGDLEIQIEPNETLDVAVERALVQVPKGERTTDEIFQVLVNGHKIEPELWSFTKLTSSDNVLIAPKIEGADGGSIFKQIAIIAVAIAVNVYAPGFGFSVVQTALLSAAATIGTSLLLNSLIPPPVQDFESGGSANDYASSQMYALTGQGNAVKKYGSVPKVYGQHRIFPVVAANPYTEIEVDPDTGELVQYLYAIYDFGLGPCKVEQIMIGDTPIENFVGVSYNLVDFNKPAVSEGPWDDATNKTLSFYKGDVNVENLAIVLDGNRSVGDAQSTWETIRNSAPNGDGRAQTITLSFVNTRGLYAYSATGQLAPRSIELEIYFSKVGEDNWVAFNDPTYVDDFLGVGGDEVFQPALMIPYPFTYGEGVWSLTDDQGLGGSGYIQPEISGYPTNLWGYARREFYGIALGATQVILKTDYRLVPGAALLHNGTAFGRILSSAPHSVPGYSIYTLQEPTTRKVNLFSADVYRAYYQGPTVPTGPWAVVNASFFDDKIYYGQGVIGKAKITRQDTSPVYSTYRFTPKNPGQYKIRVNRVSTTSEFNSQVSDSLSLVGISTRFDSDPILTDKRHTFLELRIKGTNQLNGNISNLSAVCTSALDVWNGTAWEKQLTRNPAWVFADLLTGEANKRPIPKSRLHLPSLIEWAEFCDEVPTAPSNYEYSQPRFRSDFVLDFQTTLQSLLNQVAGACQASLNIIDGKYGVLLDVKRDVPVQIFTPRNSRNFSSIRNYARRPDALLVKYIEPGLEWGTTELTVYDDGFDETNALDFDDLTCFGVTGHEQAWRFGRYMMAQNRLRQETISLEVDFEHMVCTRGDFVQITQDAMKVAGTPARAKAIAGNRVEIDDGIETSGLLSYGFVFRSRTGEIKTNTLTVVNSTTFDFDGPDLPEVGDLVIIGETTKIVFDCIVKAITPNDDLTATLVLVEKADAIYDAESSDSFPIYNPQISNTVDPDFAPPAEVEDLIIADNAYECAGSGYRYYIDLDWDVPNGSAYETFEIYVNSGKGFALAGTNRNSLYRYVVDQTRLGQPHEFKVLAVSATGKKLDLGSVGSVSATPMRKTARPSNVESLSIDITGEVLQLVWPQVLDCDCDEYLIRYSPTLTGTWEGSIPLLRVDRNTTLAPTQARTGTYLIKAVDFNGNESVKAAVAVTTIPNLFGLNLISEITDFPALLGGKDRTIREGDTLLLQRRIVGGVDDAEYYSEGFYYYKDFLDLGDIFTVRLQSLIQAEGFTAEDMMANWASLAEVVALANSRFSEWDVQSEYRSTETYNTISNWASLADIDPISEGSQELWTPWRKFIMGDATGRIFQFRLRLISNKSSVTPRVFDGTIRADMPDRIESYNNLAAPAEGYTLAYAIPFKGPGTSPNVQISIDGAESGDYWAFESKDLNGFTIKFFDREGTPVARQFDVAVKGYGRKSSSVL